MLQRLIAAVLGVLGVAAIGLGVASATVWRADDPLVATAAPGGDTRTLVTDPGVLELAADRATVTVRADGSPVVLAVGRDTDVAAWVGTDPYERVTGLSDWHTLATTAGQEAEPSAGPSDAATATAPAEAAPSPSASEDAPAAVQAADPTGNDMWVAEVAGDGSATLEWPAQEGRWSLLAVSLGDSAPVLDVSWPQTVTTPWLWPGVALGVLLLAVAAVLLVRILRERREGPDAGWTDVSTGTLATVPLPGGRATPGSAAPGGTPAGAIPVGTVTPGVPPTRRQLREAEAAAAAARRRGGRTPTGSVPVVTGATPAVTGATPAVTGATPVVTGTSPAGPAAAPAVPGATSAPGGTADGATANAAGGTTRPAGTPPAPGAAPTASSPAGPPATPGGPSAGTPGAGARDDATTTLPVTPPAPTAAAATTAPAADAGPGPDGPGVATASAGRRLADRLPWRRGRGAHDEPGAADGTTAATAGAPTGAAPAGPAPAGGSSPAPATAWAPAPRPTPGPAGSPSPSPAGSPAQATAPAARPTPRAGTPAGTPEGAASADDEAATRAQRADAWRRMWGFPSADEGGAPAQQDDDTRGTEEGR